MIEAKMKFSDLPGLSTLMTALRRAAPLLVAVTMRSLARTAGWSSGRSGAAFYAGYAAIAGGYSTTMQIKHVRFMRRA